MNLTDVTIENLERLNNSTSGNPRWLVHFTNGHHFPTLPDVAFAAWLDRECIGHRFDANVVMGELVSLVPSQR